MAFVRPMFRLGMAVLVVEVIVVERDVAQWLQRGALPMLLPAVRFRIALGA